MKNQPSNRFGWRKSITRILLAGLALLASAHQAAAQGTAFSYSGNLNNAGIPASGVFDFTFSLSSSSNDLMQVGETITNTAVPVTNGTFTAKLNFGPGILTGNALWVEIGVRTNGAANFILLSALQPILPVPYATFANTASNLSGMVASVNLSGTYGNAVTLNNGANQISGNFAGNGGGLADLPAANIVGTLTNNTMGNAATALSLTPGALITNIYPLKWVAANYTVSTNDRVICSRASTNTTYTLPSAPATGTMFTFFNKGTGILTIADGTRVITTPGVGTNLNAILGPWGSASNALTVTFDGTNY
jgi:hypothetical protein